MTPSEQIDKLIGALSPSEVWKLNLQRTKDQGQRVLLANTRVYFGGDAPGEDTWQILPAVSPAVNQRANVMIT